MNNPTQKQQRLQPIDVTNATPLITEVIAFESLKFSHEQKILIQKANMCLIELTQKSFKADNIDYPVYRIYKLQGSRKCYYTTPYHNKFSVKFLHNKISQRPKE